MPVSITANTSARYAQASLARQNEAVTQGTLRMSSGQRVLSAADDAASMAIGTSLKIENAGVASALLNATSGTSMLQIADGALGQISELITRMKALSTQASSGQYDDATRVLLDSEFQGLKSEINRLANAAVFNDVNMLAGQKDFDVAYATPTNHGIVGVRFDQTLVTGDQSFRFGYDATTENLTLTRIDGGAAQSQTINITALLNGTVGAGGNLTNNQQLELGFSQLGVTMTLGAGFLRTQDITNPVSVADGGVMTVASQTFAPATNQIGVDIVSDLGALGSVYNTTTGALTLPLDSDGAAVTLAAVPGISYNVNNGAIGASGAASADVVGAGPTTVDVYADMAAGGRVLLGTVTLGAIAATGTGSGSLSLNVGEGLLLATDTGEVTATQLTYKVGTGVAAGIDTIQVSIPAMTLQALGIEDISVTSQANANEAIDLLSSALAVLNQGRATVGAQQLRLEAVARNLGVVSDNNNAARSALIDVDVSAEITNITTNSAMMQASLAMLSRANQMPDILLGLLRN